MRVLRAVLIAVTFSVAAAGCENPFRPDEERVSPRQPYLGELIVEGYVTASDGSPIDEARVLVDYSEPVGECGIWDIICSYKEMIIAETTTNTNGYYSISFYDERCSINEQIGIAAWKLGYRKLGGIVRCRGGLQRVDVTLWPVGLFP